MKRALPTAKSRFLATFSCIATLFFSTVVFGQSSVITDKGDYAPGSTAIITGSGF